MDQKLHTIRTIAEEAAREIGTFEILGVIPTEGDLYVEILLRVNGCDIEPCRFSLGLVRDMSPKEMRTAIIKELRRHIDSHGTTRAIPATGEHSR